MLRSTQRLAIAVPLLWLTACGGPSDDVELEVHHPLYTAQISSYTGWFPGPWHQEIWIRLQPEVGLAEVADLAVFGPLDPEMSLAEARAAVDQPALDSVDDSGEVSWSGEHGKARFACVEDPESCTWGDCSSYLELRAYPKERGPESLFHPAIAQVVIEATKQKPEVAYRAVSVSTHEYTERLTLVIESAWEESLRWGRGPFRGCGLSR